MTPGTHFLLALVYLLFSGLGLAWLAGWRICSPIARLFRRCRRWLLR